MLMLLHRRHFAHRQSDGNTLQSPWCKDGILSIQWMHSNTGVIEGLKTWRLFGGQLTCLFYRHRRESSPKDGKVLPSTGMTLNPAPAGAFTVQLSGTLGHEDHEDIAHAVPCSPFQSRTLQLGLGQLGWTVPAQGMY